MGWGSIARQAAAAEYGRQNWRRYAARRQAAALVVAVVAAGGLGVAWLARHWQAGWTLLVVIGSVAVAVGLFAVALAVRSRRW